MLCKAYTPKVMAQVDINLTAKDAQAEQPWICRLCREFNVTVNIVKANVDRDFGWIQIRLDGSTEEIQRAIAWLMQTGMHVDAEQRSVRAL